MNWNILTPDLPNVERLKKEFNTSEIIARVLANRGFVSLDTTRSFFAPDLNQLYDPFRMRDMDSAVELVLQNIAAANPILVFGDYDVDGTTGAAMLAMVLKSLGANTRVYIPNRETEGYGLSRPGIDVAHSLGAGLVITCDCGINAFEQARYARELGIDLIISDHHTPDQELPPAAAILNPKRPDCEYPFKGLSGAGVAFKLACALAQRQNLPLELITAYLDIITLGTAADMVPILDENRIIVYHGLQMLQDSQRPGLKALLEISNLAGGTVSVGQIVFWLAPRINAAGRLGDANRAVELLMTEDPLVADNLATELDLENRRRQEIQQQVVDEALRMVNAQVDLERDKAIVLAGTSWHPGVVGIVASRIKDEFHRPTVIVSMDATGVGKGSARSISDFDLYQALTTVGRYLEGYGGHPMAAGLTVREENLPGFREAFVDLANQQLQPGQLQPRLTIDGEMVLQDIDPRFMGFLEKLAPYGPGNMRPKFVTRDVNISGHPRVIGNGDHIRFKVRQGRTVYDAVGFNLATQYEKLITGLPVDLAYVVETNVWQGQSYTQLNIRDIKRAGAEE